MNVLETLRRQKHLLLILSTLTVGILIGTVLTSRWGQASAQSGAADATPLVIPPLTTLGNEFTQLAKKLEESVVAIRVEVPAPAAAATANPFGDDREIPDIFRRFLPAPQGPEDGEGDVPNARPRTRTASGTGFIVDKNGYIITNSHVVENATKITVTLQHDPVQYRARFIGADYESDLAVIKIDARRPLKPVTVANSDSVQVGDWAVAIGSPFGLASTVTVGIVSALGRGPDQLGPEARAFQNFIQTDAAINPGNSGGPLLNIRGEVIGINTMIETATGGSNGVGFAVPMNMGVRVYNDIIRDGRVTRGSIGVSLSGGNPEAVLRAFKLDHGAIIEDVRSGGPAAKAGMKPGDIVLAINGKPVKDNQDLISIVADLPVGREASFRVDRDGEARDLKINIVNRADFYADDQRIVGSSKAPVPAGEVKPASTEIRFGFRVRGPVTELEKDLVPSRRGVVVASVEEDSFAAEIGLRENDIVESINRQPVTSVEDINRIRSGLKPGDAVALRIYRPIPAPVRGARGKNQPAAVSGATGMYLAGSLPER